MRTQDVSGIRIVSDATAATRISLHCLWWIWQVGLVALTASKVVFPDPLVVANLTRLQRVLILPGKATLQWKPALVRLDVI